MSVDTGNAVLVELNRYEKLREMLKEETDDPRAILDTLEGETNLNEALLVVADSALDDETMAEAIKLRIEGLQARKSRCEVTAENKRGLITMAMERAGLKTVKGPSATLTVRPLLGTALVDNEADVPAKFWRPRDPALDKSALTEALRNGETVEGAKLSNGGVSLTIRVK